MSKPRFRLRVNRSQSDKTEAAACASSHRRVRERERGRLSHSPEPLLAREGTLFILHYTRRHYEGCAVCVSRARVCVSARVDISVYTRRVSVRSQRRGKVEEKEEEDLRIVGSGGKGGGITSVRAVTAKGWRRDGRCRNPEDCPPMGRSEMGRERTRGR